MRALERRLDEARASGTAKLTPRTDGRHGLGLILEQRVAACLAPASDTRGGANEDRNGWARSHGRQHGGPPAAAGHEVSPSIATRRRCSARGRAPSARARSRSWCRSSSRRARSGSWWPAAGVDATLAALTPLLSRDDAIIDGGNSHYRDDIRRAKALAAAGIHYVDVGTSGGVWGKERGYCQMIGGDAGRVQRLDPIFAALAPSVDVGAAHARAQRDRPRPPSTAICAADPAARATSSRWCTTGSSTG